MVRLQHAALEAFKLITSRVKLVGSDVSKNAFPQFSKFIALLELGKCPSAEEMLPSSTMESPYVNQK